MSKSAALRSGLLAASSFAVLSISSTVSASDGGAAPDGVIVEDYSGIVVNENVDNNSVAPEGAIDSVAITGVGQMVTRPNPNTFGIGLCTGSLINPRTVIFAAHCVNDVPGDAYGAESGGIPISFGFDVSNIEAVRHWIGLRDPADQYQSLPELSIYNVEHVWYDPRSQEDIFGLGFLEADIALATLDTPAFDIPTWALLFSPLTEQVHVTITGYGRSSTDPLLGDNQGIDFLRRTAENILSFAGSLDDRNDFLFGPGDVTFPQTLYSLDFDSPGGAESSDFVTQFDFDLFDGPALPREGTTAGGDSGGPLIVDEAFDIPVVAGVLSGGSRFFGPQPFSAYGTQSFYQPLFLFWETLVANNNYVYATTKGGDGQWTDPGHWIQEMDPNYQVIRDGELVNALPGSPEGGVTGDTTKFGDVCFLDDCQNFDQIGPEDPGTGAGLFVEGGPGSENFVPNNVAADPSVGQRPRYYEVTLREGKTTLSGADIEIDLLTVDGATLDVDGGASLTALGEFTQTSGWTNIDGTLSASDGFLLSGLLSGSGTFVTPVLTSVAGVIAPGGADNIDTFTVDGAVIMASGSALLVDADRSGADRLHATDIVVLSANEAGEGPSLVFNKPVGGKAPRHGQSFTIVSGENGVFGEFGTTYSFQGVLRPELTYTGTEVIAELRAGALVEMIGQNSPEARAFASALDTLRSGHYNALYSLYGVVDLMDSATLTTTLGNLAPDMDSYGMQMRERQSQALFGAVTDRLSLMGSAQGGSMQIYGAPSAMMPGAGEVEQAELQAGFAGLSGDRIALDALPEGFTGYVTGGTVANGASAGFSQIDGGRSSYFGMGLEREVSSNFSMGVAVGYADGVNQLSGDTASTRMTQVAAYGSYQLGQGAYVGFAGNLEQSETDTSRVGAVGNTFGAQDSTRLSMVAETGVNMKVTKGLTLTPRAQLGYSRDALSNMDEFGSDSALAIDDLTIRRIDARFGAKLAGSEDLGGGWKVTPQLSADYVRMLDGSDNGLTVRFSAADSVAIALPYAFGDTSWGELKGGIQVRKGNLSFGAGFETAIGREDLSTDRAMGTMNIRF